MRLPDEAPKAETGTEHPRRKLNPSQCGELTARKGKEDDMKHKDETRQKRRMLNP